MSPLRTRLRPLALAAVALLAVALAPRHALVRHHHAGGGLAHVHLEGLDPGDHHHHVDADHDHDGHHHAAAPHHDHLGGDLDHDDHDHAVARHHLHRLRHAGAPSLIAGGDPDHTHWQDPFHRVAAPTPPVLAVATTAVRLVAPATPPPGRRPGLAPSSRGPPALLA